MKRVTSGSKKSPREVGFSSPSPEEVSTEQGSSLESVLGRMDDLVIRADSQSSIEGNGAAGGIPEHRITRSLSKSILPSAPSLPDDILDEEILQDTPFTFSKVDHRLLLTGGRPSGASDAVAEAPVSGIPNFKVAGCIFIDFKKEKFVPQNCMFAYNPKNDVHRATVIAKVKSIATEARKLHIKCEIFDSGIIDMKKPVTQVGGLSTGFTSRRFPPPEAHDWSAEPTKKKGRKSAKKAKIEVKVFK